MRSLVGRPLALMLHLKIYDLQWKETQESSSLNILLLRPEIPEPERGSDLPNSSHSEPALSVAFLLFPCIARAQVNLLRSEEELQGPRCECKSSVEPLLLLLLKDSLETCILSCMKRVASPGLMHDSGCLGLVHWDDPEGWNGEGWQPIRTSA